MSAPTRAPRPALNRRAFGVGVAMSVLGGVKAVAQPGPGGILRRPPARPPARFLIVLLHGFGSNGADMFGLVPSFQPYAPTAAFTAPDGFFSTGDGFSWFPVGGPGLNNERDRMARAAAAGGPALDALFDAELARHGLGPERLILLGFSQGASAALNTGLRRKTPPAAVIAFSGANLSPDGLPRIGRLPPVLLISGDQDERVPVAAQQQAMRVLNGIGAPAQAHLLKGLGHGIDDRGIRLAGELIRLVTGAQA
jgi:phospholipase/carboxylesterase